MFVRKCDPREIRVARTSHCSADPKKSAGTFTYGLSPYRANYRNAISHLGRKIRRPRVWARINHVNWRSHARDYLRDDAVGCAVMRARIRVPFSLARANRHRGTSRVGLDALDAARFCNSNHERDARRGLVCTGDTAPISTRKTWN